MHECAVHGVNCGIEGCPLCEIVVRNLMPVTTGRAVGRFISWEWNLGHNLMVAGCIARAFEVGYWSCDDDVGQVYGGGWQPNVDGKAAP
jgi:hypothetical protein